MPQTPLTALTHKCSLILVNMLNKYGLVCVEGRGLFNNASSFKG